MTNNKMVKWRDWRRRVVTNSVEIHDILRGGSTLHHHTVRYVTGVRRVNIYCQPPETQ